MDSIATRNFKVTGQLDCLFTPETTPTTEHLADIEVELWQKSPLDIIFLGRGLTNSDGVFTIDFELEGPNPIIEDGKINEVFVKAYYQGVLLTGDNPYT